MTATSSPANMMPSNDRYYYADPYEWKAMAPCLAAKMKPLNMRLPSLVAVDVVGGLGLAVISACSSMVAMTALTRTTFERV